MQIEYLDVSSLPMLNTALEVDGKYPPVVEAFRQKILEADSFLFASPEYNYSGTSGSRRNQEKKRSTAEKKISLSVLQQYFSGSLKDAAKSLGEIPLT